MQSVFRAALGAALLWGGACTSRSPEAPTNVGTTRDFVAGNIHPGAIQIDGPASSPPGSDLFPDAGTPLNAGATRDWVLDTLANSGSSCLGSDGIATCIQAGVTGAAGGTGHWNGVRIVDGIGGDDQDIFLTGGKENDTTTWNIGPGTVGSSKYDMVQAYLANNQSDIFFGMERRGNNGTTAFDFEFNALAPMALSSCPQLPQVPCRSVGDVLFTFEMQGSGSSGSADPFIFTWNGTEFVEGTPTGIVSSINNSTTTAGGPWGHVDSHGNWVLGDLDRFTFAEAKAPISLLPGVNACGGTAYVQVRTRSSSTEKSDLKDTSKIFQFNFLGVTAAAQLLPSCDGGFEYRVQASDPNGPIDAGCNWAFSDGTGSTSCNGFQAVAAGTYGGFVQVQHPLLSGCGLGVDAGTIAAYAPLAVTPSMTATCNLSFGYDAGVTGGANPANFVYGWSFTGAGTVVPSTSSARSGSASVSLGNTLYSGAFTVTETRQGITCSATGNASATPYAPLAVDLALAAAPQTCQTDGGMTTDAVTYTASLDGGTGNYTLVWSGPVCSGSSCTINPSDSLFCAAQSVYATLSDTSGLCPPVNSETESYSKVTTVQASDNP